MGGPRADHVVEPLDGDVVELRLVVRLVDDDLRRQGVRVRPESRAHKPREHTRQLVRQLPRRHVVDFCRQINDSLERLRKKLRSLTCHILILFQTHLVSCIHTFFLVLGRMMRRCDWCSSLSGSMCRTFRSE